MAARKVRSKRQPSLPGFPDIPDSMPVAIPTMGWKQIGGDIDLSGVGGTIAMADGEHIELLKIQPVREYVGDGEAAEVGYPFWSREAWYELEDLDLKNDDVRSALDSIGIDLDNPEDWFQDLTPEQRALGIAEALLDYGYRVDEGPSGWSSDMPDYEVEVSSGRVVSLRDELSYEDDEFKNDVLGYDDIRQKLEETVERLADASAAQAWSTVGDREQSDAEKEGFDPESLVHVAEFGDAVGVNGDLELEKTEAGVSGDLEKEGYEMLDRGGRVPSTEEHVSAEHAIEAVAKEMGLDEDVVAEAAKGLDWWPKDTRYEEIAWTTSGSAYLWGKKDKYAHVEDGDYVIQGAWSDGRISETFSMNDEGAAVDAAKKLLRDPTFEGDSVRVITRDGELVWSSEPEGNETEEARRRPARRNRRR